MKNLLILDLDETLIHARESALDYPEDFQAYRYFVYKRPFLDDFLEFIKGYFRVAVWTASDKMYAEKIVSEIFPESYELEFLLSRDHCTLRFDFELQEYYQVKKLKKLKKSGYRLENILIVDDTPKKAEQNYGNYIRVKAFEGERNDNELSLLMDYLPTLSAVDNVRHIEKRNWRFLI